MLYKLGKKFFEFLKNVLHFSQVVLIFLCFAIVLFWILQIAQVKWIEPVAPFFDSIKQFVHIFYQRNVTVDEVSIDFSFLVATFFILALVWLIKPIIEYIENAEKHYDKIYNFIKKKSEDIFNKSLEGEYVSHEEKNKKGLILVKFALKNLSKDKFYNHDVSDGVEMKTNEILLEFYEIVGEEFGCKRKIIKDNVVMEFSDINKINEMIVKLNLILNSLKKKYIEDRWEISSIISLDCYADVSQVAQKLTKLIFVNNLGLLNKIICTSSFKQRYSLLKEQAFSIQLEGTYKLGENNEEIYLIKA